MKHVVSESFEQFLHVRVHVCSYCAIGAFVGIFMHLVNGNAILFDLYVEVKITHERNSIRIGSSDLQCKSSLPTLKKCCVTHLKPLFLAR